MNDRTRAALVGLAKAGPPPDPATPAEALAADRPGDTAETRFLLAAAAADLWAEAGRLPAPAPPPRCPPETAPPPPAGVDRLAAAIFADHPVLIPELCRRLTAGGFVLPPGVLPAALSVKGGGFVRGDLPLPFTRDLRAALVPVLGERGRWLAAQNPDWAWVRDESPDTPRVDGLPSDPADFGDAFAADEFGVRRAALERWRAADPAGARDALAGVWKGETAFRRAALLGTFETGLSPDDEPFLGAALADRSKAVPNAALELLLKLPNSAHAQRLRVLADGCLDVTGEGRKRTLNVTLPAADADVPGGGKDGGGKGDAGRGERAAALVRAVGAVRPSHWTDRFGLSAAGLIELAAGDTHGGAAIAGWLEACGRFAAIDPAATDEWLTALSAWAADRLNRRRGKGDPAGGAEEVVQPFPALVRRLPPTAAARVVGPLLGAAAVVKDFSNLGLALWDAVPDPWPDDFGRAVADAVAVAAARGRSQPWVWGYVALRLAPRLPPAVLSGLSAEWPAPGLVRAPADECLAAVLAVRRRIHELLPVSSP